MKIILLFLIVLFYIKDSNAQTPPKNHPDVSSSEWNYLFKPDLSNAGFPKGIWFFENGILTATEDKAIWSEKIYDNFILDLEFKTAQGTNSGVFLYASDTAKWVTDAVEVQIADDFDEQWANAPASWRCGAIFGRLPPKKSMVKKPGDWNRFTITCKDNKIWVMLNGVMVNELDMNLWKDPRKNPDGTDIPEWLSKPLADLPTKGHIGFQGKHAGAPIFFRNIKIKEI